MAEDLAPADVAAYTNNRLLATDPGTLRILNAVLGQARRFCGWHVCPVRTDTITVRGTGEQYLELPTLNVIEVESITEVQYDDFGDYDFAGALDLPANGAPPGQPVPVQVDPTAIRVYPNEPSTIYRKYDRFHRHYEYIVTYTHGYAAADAADFQEAVLQWIDAYSLTIGSAGAGPVESFQVDDVTTDWAVSRAAGTVLNNPLAGSALHRYRILPVA